MPHAYSKQKENKMGRDKDRITVRLSSADLKGLSKIQASGDFDEMSDAVRWCLHFTLTMMRMIPAAIINSFVESEETEKKIKIKKDDSLEKPAEQPFSTEKA